LLSFCADSYFDRQVRDAVLDFDAIVKNPAKPDELIQAYNCGDGVHPSNWACSARSNSTQLPSLSWPGPKGPGYPAGARPRAE